MSRNRKILVKINWVNLVGYGPVMQMPYRRHDGVTGTARCRMMLAGMPMIVRRGENPSVEMGSQKLMVFRALIGQDTAYMLWTGNEEDSHAAYPTLAEAKQEANRIVKESMR